LIDLADVWIHFDLREDLVKGLKVGDRFDVHIPALDDRRVTVEVKLIATKGEYASWRATRASGDFEPADVFNPRLPCPAGARAATGDERLSRLAIQVMRPASKPDFCSSHDASATG